MQYLILVITYTAAMLLIYLLLLRNKPVYALSRYYLLACAILPIVIPFIMLPQGMEQTLQRAVAFQVTLPTFTVSAAQKIGKTEDVGSIMWTAYSIIATLIIVWQLWSLFRLWQVIRNNKNEKQEGYTLVTASEYGPGSFGRFIILPGEEINETILAHEQAHVRLRHTADVLFLNLVQALFWPNIFLLWIKKELRQVHEFQADAAININKDDNIRLLLGSVFNTPELPVMHLFIIHPIKRRIMMLQKNRSAAPVKTALIVGSAFILFISVAVGIQSCNKKAGAIVNANPQSKQALLNPPPSAGKNRPNPDNNGIYTHVQQMPKAGYDVSTYLGKHIRFPDYARKNHISGKVVIRFVIDEHGNVTNAECLKPADTCLINEALRVVSAMPPWKPGEQDGKKVPVYYILPMLFQQDATK